MKGMNYIVSCFNLLSQCGLRDKILEQYAF